MQDVPRAHALTTKMMRAIITLFMHLVINCAFMKIRTCQFAFAHRSVMRDNDNLRCVDQHITWCWISCRRSRLTVIKLHMHTVFDRWCHFDTQFGCVFIPNQSKSMDLCIIIIVQWMLENDMNDRRGDRVKTFEYSHIIYELAVKIYGSNVCKCEY